MSAGKVNNSDLHIDKLVMHLIPIILSQKQNVIANICNSVVIRVLPLN